MVTPGVTPEAGWKSGIQFEDHSLASKDKWGWIQELVSYQTLVCFMGEESDDHSKGGISKSFSSFPCKAQVFESL